MYEQHHENVIPRSRFALRILGHCLAAVGLLLLSLLAGMAGYSRYESLGWQDAFLNAAMLLGGMGPVDPPQTPDGKIFEGLFALYSGIVFVVTTGIIIAPILHRLLHRFHVIDDDPKPSSSN